MFTDAELIVTNFSDLRYLVHITPLIFRPEATFSYVDFKFYLKEVGTKINTLACLIDI